MDTTSGAPSYLDLSGLPAIDYGSNLLGALAAGRRVGGMVAEMLALRRAPGKLTPQEYLYYRLWAGNLSPTAKRQFVGKLAQHPMHLAAGSREWFAAAADKILFHSIMKGAGFRTPEVLAITQAGRSLQGCSTIADQDTLARWLRDPALYPLFAKPVAGKYSLSVVSAEDFDDREDEVLLLGGERRKVTDLAGSLVGGGGYLIQKRLAPDRDLAVQFGPRLWSARLLVLITSDGPVIHRAVAKIATGHNQADNFWRKGNRLAAVDRATGQITRVVEGSGAEEVVDMPHPETGNLIKHQALPRWCELTERVRSAAQVFAGIRTQSWDVALSDDGPVFLELNFGGDLNLHQLAHRRGVLDGEYREHLRRCGYRGRL